MSRIGKKPVIIPEGVEVKVESNKVTAKGPLGVLDVTIRPEIIVKLEGKEITLTRANDERHTRALHGFPRTAVSDRASIRWRESFRTPGEGAASGVPR